MHHFNRHRPHFQPKIRLTFARAVHRGSLAPRHPFNCLQVVAQFRLKHLRLLVNSQVFHYVPFLHSKQVLFLNVLTLIQSMVLHFHWKQPLTHNHLEQLLTFKVDVLIHFNHCLGHFIHQLVPTVPAQVRAPIKVPYVPMDLADLPSYLVMIAEVMHNLNYLLKHFRFGTSKKDFALFPDCFKSLQAPFLHIIWALYCQPLILVYAGTF